MQATAARPTQSDSAHWYSCDGIPCYTQIAKSTGQPRPTTLADARKQNLLPSVTTLLRVLNKPALNDWITEQAVLAVLTTPRLPNEPDDQFVQRVLHTERIQDQESQKARDLGTDIHAALEARFTGAQLDESLIPWIQPAYEAVTKQCPTVVATEVVLVGNGYAGKCDLIAQDEQCWEWIFDFKTTKKLPSKESYWEHKLQTAAYLQCRPNGRRHANVYISTLEQGQFVIHDNGDYAAPYEAFRHLVRYWQIANNYTPEQV